MAVTTDGTVARIVVGDFGHQRLLLLQISEQRVQSAGRQHPVAGQHVEIAFFGILWQVTDFAGTSDRSGIGFALPGQDAQGAGLARAVAPDQPDAIAGLNPQIGAVG